MDFAMNLCLRAKAVEVVTIGSDTMPPVVPEDPTLRGRAAELHRQFSHMKEPVLVPRDQLVINLDFDVDFADGAPWSPRSQPTAAGVAAAAEQTPPTAPQPDPLSGAATITCSSSSGANTMTCSTEASAGRGDVAAAKVAPGSGPNAPAAAAARGTVEASAGPFVAPSSAARAAIRGAPDAEEGGDGGPRGSSTVPAGGGSGGGSGDGGGGGHVSWAEGLAASHARGFVRVKSARPPEGLSWTHSRRCLEVLLTEERSNRSSSYLSHEQRLRERLERLNLEMVIVAGDGNCQFRSISNELYGTQDHHAVIRRQAVSHILSQRDAFEAFLGEDFEQYVRQMERSGTWGDELTLRAVCDSFGLTVHVVTSDEDHWYLTYQPERRKLDREIFLTYIAPIHYNSIRRRSSLKTMALSMSRSFQRVSTGIGSRIRGSGSAPESPMGMEGLPSASGYLPLTAARGGGGGGCTATTSTTTGRRSNGSEGW